MTAQTARTRNRASKPAIRFPTPAIATGANRPERIARTRGLTGAAVHRFASGYRRFLRRKGYPQTCVHSQMGYAAAARDADYPRRPKPQSALDAALHGEPA